MENVLALIAATTALILVPGPNVALIVASSLRHGLASGLLTAAGTTTGLALQLLLVVAGMATAMEMVGAALSWIKWLGVIYLLYLGIRVWGEPASDLADVRTSSRNVTFWRGVGLAVINPKTLLFTAAFLPQFVPDANDAGRELLVLGAVFLSVIIAGDAMWAIFASTARHWISRFGHLRNRVTGGFLVLSGIGLALSRRNN